MARRRGNPVITLRLDPGTIVALRTCAEQHKLTVSGLIRRLIYDQLRADRISKAPTPIEGQLHM